MQTTADHTLTLFFALLLGFVLRYLLLILGLALFGFFLRLLFGSGRQSEVNLSKNQELKLDVQLELGVVTEQVQVVGAAPIMNTAMSEVGPR